MAAFFVVYRNGEPDAYSEHRDNAERHASGLSWRFPLDQVEIRESDSVPEKFSSTP